MPISYVITVIVVGAFTALALAPPTRPRAVVMAGYLLGMVISEVPHLAAGLALGLATASAFARGDVSADPSSLIPLAAAGVVFIGLTVLVRRGVRARHAVASGLDAVGVVAPRLPRWWAWRTAVTPLPIRPRNVVRVRDLPYGPHRRNRADVYHRKDLSAGGPVLLYLHGGGYYSGSKHHEGRALLHLLAARGWVCVSATYRLRPQVGFEEHLADARAALAWARTYAAELGADPDQVAMAGSSAGAHLTSLCAPDPALSIRAAICLYGYYGRYYGRGADEAVASTPFALDLAAAPPTFLAHGDRDTMTPVGESLRLAETLRRATPGPVASIVLPGGQHGFDLVKSWRYSAVLAGIEAFLADQRVGLLPPTSSAERPDLG